MNIFLDLMGQNVYIFKYIFIYRETVILLIYFTECVEKLTQKLRSLSTPPATI